MPAAFVRKLEHGAPLTAADRGALAAAVGFTKTLPAHQDIIREGERPEYVHVVLSGFACRYRSLPDGGRQIMAWLVPGDSCDLHVSILGKMDHSIATLSISRIAFLSRAEVEALTTSSPTITQACWWATLVDEGILREWLVNMGRKAADRQIAHMFCELLSRLEAVGLAKGHAFELPLTQVELADAVGLSSVHVNRVIQDLRDQGLIRWRGMAFEVIDRPRLTALAGFDANYLHLRARQKAAGALIAGTDAA